MAGSLRLTILTLAALTLVPATARAATVSVLPPPPCSLEASKHAACDPPHVAFAAAPGEANRLTITTGEGLVRFREESLPVQAGEGCTAVSANEATCPGTIGAVADVGDGDDVVDLPSGDGASVAGGPGNDRITGSTGATGGPGNDTLVASPGSFGSQLYGGAGDDTLTGTAGADTLFGGAGHDVITAGDGDDQLNGGGWESGRPVEPGGDTIDGGAGTDSLSYETGRRAVTVDLSRPDSPAGVGGERDTLSGIENVTGGKGADRLTGDAGANVLRGGPGADVVDGGAGADTVSGGAGRDRLSGGAGNDIVVGSGGSHRATTRPLDRLGCGAGRDRVEGNDALIARDCERFYDGDPLIVPYPRRVRPRALSFSVSCPRYERRRGRCRGSLAVGDRRARLSLPARGGLVTVRGRRFARRVSVKLTIRGRYDTARARYFVTLR